MERDYNFSVNGFIASRDTDHRHRPEAMGKVTILHKVGSNEYLVRTETGIVCKAIYNPFAGAYFVDDIHTAIQQDNRI